MTILKCSATNCIYNDARQCSRGEIDVMGESARIADETSCGSFQERSGSAMNSMEHHCGCEKIQIDCKAHNCAYNDNCKCTAAAIDVDGSRAQCSQETKCGTFACKC
nr:DUF1540 domain-containing protein [uncultured Blautia sp.]